MKSTLKEIKTENFHNGGLKVITEGLESNPHCPHGPTLLFSRKLGQRERQFYACSACRDRKLCNFFLWADERDKISKSKLDALACEKIKFLRGINHKKLFLLLNKVKALPLHKRAFCTGCSTFTGNIETRHAGHSLITNLSGYQLDHPLEILPPLGNSKKEAQYLFSKSSVQFLVDSFLSLNYRHVICIGTPRVHEYIRSSATSLSSILLDIDDRFHSFFGPLEFCWYNSFNNHFFFEEARNVFEEFLKSTKGEHTVLITDPPFGGRTEPLAQTFSSIATQYKQFNRGKSDLPIFWVFPYFMEPQILNSLTHFHMLDYKVQYDNHVLFQNGPKGRKRGSPVRIFTNISPKLIKLPEDDYKFCQECDKWVSKENRHCILCGECTSKNGETYVHCNHCQRCVKPNWRHCRNCQRCAQSEHKCDIIEFTGVCLNCGQSGHKKNDCPELVEKRTLAKRKMNKLKRNKNKKVKS